LSGNAIADLFVSLGLDTKAFSKGIDDTGKKVSTFGKATTVGLAGMGVAFGVMTKGAMEAERAQGDFMAATGATRAEAKLFVSGMDSLAGSVGSVGLSFEQISSAGTMVAQQFGTTGQATTDLTETVLEFSKVTKQDATQAAGQLEDTLTAYGLSASDAAGFTDKLVASSQKWGTDVGPTQLSVIQKMGPALTNLGGDMDDAIGVLNLFEASGGNATDAIRGLTSAAVKLPDGQNLDQFVEHLSDLKEQGLDPTTEAVKVFGNKAGLSLARAIQPGMDGMEDLTASAEEADGAVRTAGEAMMTTSDKIRGIADKMMAGAREIGQGFGPAITGAASLATLGGSLARSLKIGTLVSPLAKVFKAGIAGGWAAASKGVSLVAAPITAAISRAFAGIGASIAANKTVMGGIDNVGKLMGGRLGTAMKGVAIIALAAIAAEQWGQLQQQIADNRAKAAEVQKASGDFLSGMPTATEVQAKIDALKALPSSLDPLKRALFETGGLGGLLGADPKAVWQTQIDELQAYLDNGAAPAIADSVEGISEAGADALTTGATTVDKAFDDLVQSYEDGSAAVVDAGSQLAMKDAETGIWNLGPDIDAASEETQDAITDWVTTQNDAVVAGAGKLGASLDDLKGDITSKLSAVQDAFSLDVDTKKKKNISGAKRLSQMADDIDKITKRMNESIKANDPVNTAYWEQALIDAKNKYDTAKNSISVDADQIAADVAAATSSAGADMNHLGDKANTAAATINSAAATVTLTPAVTAVDLAADDMRENFRLTGQAAAQVPNGIQANVEAAGTASQHLATAASTPLDNLNLYNYGEHASSDWISGLKDGAANLGSVASHWANLLADKLGFSSPPPEGPLHDLPHWGPHMIDQWLGPMERSGLPKVAHFASRLAAAMSGVKDGHKSADWYDTARPVNHDVAPLPWRHRRHPSNPDVGDSSDGGITINVTVQGNIYGPGGTKQLAADLDRYLRRSKRGGQRLVGAY